MSGRRRHLWRDRSGGSLIEFAIAAPLLILVLAGIAQYCWVQHCASSLRYALSVSSRSLMLSPNMTQEAFVTLVVLTIQGVWNDFLSPLMVLQEQSLFTVNLGLQFYRSAYQISWTQMMAASLLSTIPVILLFLVAQRSFVSGTLEGSDK